MAGERRALAAGTIALLGLVVFVSLRLTVVTDITHFLPDGAHADDVHVARQLATGELSRTMVILVDAADDDAAVSASLAFEAALRSEPHVAAGLAFLDAGPPGGFEDAVWQTYEPHQFAFLADSAAAATARLTPEALAMAAEQLKRRLASPVSGLLSRVAPGDPLLVLPHLFERLGGGRAAGLRVVGGRFLTAKDSAAVLFLGTRASASDGSTQRPFLAGVEAAFASVAARLGGDLSLELSGTNRFAARAEAAIRTDIERVGIGSTIGLVAFLLLLFRSLRLVLFVLPVLATGFLAGVAACQIVFGNVHGLTLAFGAALIGVSVDYAVHFHCQWALAPAIQGPRATLWAIWRPLVLGASTTVVGFVAMTGSAFPGLRQLAMFAVAGISAALLATWAFLPGLAPRGASSTPASRRLVALLRAALGARRWLLALPAVLVTGVAVIGLPAARWNDDIAALNRLDPDLLAADEAVRARVGRYEQRRLVVATGTDEEGALAANDSAATILAAAAARGELGDFRSLAEMVPSARRQREVDAAVRGDSDLWLRTQAAFEGAGFRAEAFAPFRDAQRRPAPTPLRPADLEGTPLAPLVRPFRISLDGAPAFVTFLHDLRDEAAVRTALAPLDGVRLIDVPGTLTAAYTACRERMLQLWFVGLGAVLLLVGLRHRAARPTLAACLPAVLAAVGTVGLLALCGVELSLLSLVALLMIVSMGVDYGIFLAETHTDPARLDAALVAVFVAGTSTAFGFGLLGLSDQPPLHSIGLTSAVGVLLCLVLAPTMCALAERTR